jgi:SPP1 family predicted phage head-tail adaptor
MNSGAGKRRDRITFQVRAAGQGSMGQPVNTWTDVLTVYARVVATSGSEQFKGQQFNPEVTHHIEIKNSSQTDQLTPLHRVNFNGKILDITSINPGERRLDDITITCKERVLNTGNEQ